MLAQDDVLLGRSRDALSKEERCLADESLLDQSFPCNVSTKEIHFYVAVCA